MAGNTTLPVVIPTFAETLIHSLAMKLLTTLATLLAGYGAFGTDTSTTSGQEASFISVGVGLVVWLVGIGWTYLRTRVDTNRTIALANAPAIVPPITLATGPGATMAPIANPPGPAT